MQDPSDSPKGTVDFKSDKGTHGYRIVKIRKQIKLLKNYTSIYADITNWNNITCIANWTFTFLETGVCKG